MRFRTLAFGAVVVLAVACGAPPTGGVDVPRQESGDGQPRRGGPIGGPARTPQDATAAFMRFDADADGVLQRTELPSQFRSLLTRADTDGDGAASQAEILALMTAEAGGGQEAEAPQTGGESGDGGRQE